VAPYLSEAFFLFLAILAGSLFKYWRGRQPSHRGAGANRLLPGAVMKVSAGI
jgi:hypothetical protein